MRRKYKILFIIGLSVLLTYFIYFFNLEHKVYLVAIGDGIASGETTFNIDGISYNDYLKEYFEGKHLLKNYNQSYAYKNYKISNLINDLNNNKTKPKSKLNVKQIIHKATILTIGIGEEELVKLAMTNDLTKEVLDDYLKKYDVMLAMLKEITEAKIMLVSFYENSYLDKSNVIILNAELNNLALKYDCSFINISDLIVGNDYFLNSKSYYFNYKGHQEIANMLIHSI